MTTVACRDGIMACDSQLSGGFVSKVSNKVIVGPNLMVGFCGDYAAGFTGAAFLAGIASDRPDMNASDDCEFLVTDGKKIWYADTYLRMAPIADKFWAIGSGGTAAMAAMYMDASAIEAIKIAIKLDDGSSGRVRSYSLG